MINYFKTNYTVALISALLVGLALVLSLSFFMGQSLRLDEAQSLWQTSHGVAGILYTVAQDVHLPLYHLLLHFWQLWLGPGVLTARLFSLLFFLLSIPLVYFLGKKYFGEAVGSFAATIFAISPFMNWYGNEVRMYSLITFFTLANQYLFLKIFQAEGRASRLAWSGYALSALVGIYTHYFFFLLLAAQVAFFLVWRKHFAPGSWKKFAVVGIILTLAILPWVLYVQSLGFANNYRPLIPTPAVITIVNTFSQFLAGFHNDQLNSLVLSLWPLLVLLGFLALQRHKNFSPEVAFLLYSIVLPILLALGLSFAIRPVFLSRYLIITLPALYLFIAWLVSRYSPRVALVTKSLLAVSMVVMLLVQNFNSDTPVKEDYRAASLYLEGRATAQDVVAVSAPFTIYPIDYYYQGDARLATLPAWDRFQSGPIPAFSPEQLATDVAELSRSHQTLWVLLSYDQGYEEEVRLYLDNNFERVDAREFSPNLTLYAYKLRYDEEPFAELVTRLERETRTVAEAPAKEPTAKLVSSPTR